MSACTICGRESSTCPGHLRDVPDLRAENRRLREELNLIESNYIAMKSQHDTVCRANEEITQERDAAIARAENSDRRNEHLQMQLTQALASGEKADCKLATLRAQLAASEAQVERMRGALEGGLDEVVWTKRQEWPAALLCNWCGASTSESQPHKTGCKIQAMEDALTITPARAIRAVKLEAVQCFVARLSEEWRDEDDFSDAAGRIMREMEAPSAIRRELGEGA